MMTQQTWIKEIRLIIDEDNSARAKPAQKNDSILYARDDVYSLHLGPDGILSCSFKTDLEDIRTLISGETTEDLSEDELGRVAREELRPLVTPFRQGLIKAGFQEGVQADHDHYAIVFTKALTDLPVKEASEVVKWWRDAIIKG